MRPGNPEREENVRTGSAGWQPEQAPCAGVCGQSKAEASCQRRAATVGSHRGDASFSKGLSSQAEAWAGGADGRLPPGERRLGLGGGEAPAQKAEGGVWGRPGPRASERHRAGAGPGGNRSGVQHEEPLSTRGNAERATGFCVWTCESWRSRQ